MNIIVTVVTQIITTTTILPQAFTSSNQTISHTSNLFSIVCQTTDANTTNFHYGVIKSYNFRDYDNDHAITLVGDEATYELETNTTLATLEANARDTSSREAFVRLATVPTK